MRTVKKQMSKEERMIRNKKLLGNDFKGDGINGSLLPEGDSFVNHVSKGENEWGGGGR